VTNARPIIGSWTAKRAAYRANVTRRARMPIRRIVTRIRVSVAVSRREEEKSVTNAHSIIGVRLGLDAKVTSFKKNND